MQPIDPLATDDERRKFVVITGAIAGVGAIATAIPLVSSFAPSERARAMGASVEVDIGDLAPSTVKTVEWRGKPVWIMRRTSEMVAGLASLEDKLVDPRSLRDQQPEYARNPHRSIKEEILVTVGICTHLGCSPNVVPKGTLNPSVGEDWTGGFFCPCHGSTFDFAGRVFKNKPAPTNLEVPPHSYISDSKLLIGEDNLT
jgi:ubiquinol-cytochrome c reductase iron-sulfur subunit